MRTRNFSLVAAAAALLFVSSLWAQSQQPTDNPPKPQNPAAATQTSAQQTSTTAKANMNVKAANTLVICRCGMAFAPTASTQSVTHEGNQYLVCSDVCYKAASSNPAQAAKDSQTNMRKVIAQSTSPGELSGKPN